MLGRRAGLRSYPTLNAGWPQHVCPSGSRSAPNRAAAAPSPPRLGKKCPPGTCREKNLMVFLCRAGDAGLPSPGSESIAGLLEAARDHARARKEQGRPHFAPPRGEARRPDGKRCRRDRAFERAVNSRWSRMRRHGVHRAAEIAALHCMKNDEGKVVEGDPADVLTTLPSTPPARPEQRSIRASAPLL